MTTSSVTAWSLTARDIIRAAMQETATLGLGREPKAKEEEACLVRLNALLKGWQVRGASLFGEAEATVTTTGGDASVTLPGGVRDVTSVRLINFATSERPLFPWTRDQYFSLPNKASAGNPTIYYLSRGVGAAEMYLWPVSATAATLKLDYARVLETVTNPSQTIDIPEEWQEAVYANLAVRIAGVFGATIGQELAQRAQMLEARLLDAYRPDSYFMESAAC